MRNGRADDRSHSHPSNDIPPSLLLGPAVAVAAAGPLSWGWGAALVRSTPADFILSLKSIVGANRVLTDIKSTRPYRTGRRCGGGAALAVVRPHTLIEQRRVLQACVKANKIIVMQAANTGLTGGSTPDGDNYDRDVVIVNPMSRDAREVARWNRLHPGEERRIAHIEKCLSDPLPIVAATDYVAAYPQLIGSYLKNRFVAVGTDGFGRSDARTALRSFFEVNRHHTPPGVGLGQKPDPIYLRPGQTMRLAIDGLGVQQQLLAAEG